jgi:hypothetical protein
MPAVRLVMVVIISSRVVRKVHSSFGFPAACAHFHFLQQFLQKEHGSSFMRFLNSTFVQKEVNHILHSQAHHRYFFVELTLTFSELVRSSSSSPSIFF